MKRTIIMLLLACLSIAGQSQRLMGPTTVTVGTTYSYEFTGSPMSNYYWDCSHGNVVSHGPLYAHIQITSAGSGSVCLVDLDTYDEYCIYFTATIGAPTAGAATGVTTTGFTANWGSVTGATGYRLDVSTSGSFTSFVSGYNNLYVAGTSRSVTGLSPGTAYYYRVRTVAGGGTSSNSGTITVTTGLDAPVATPATDVSTTCFTADWNSVQGATSYRLDVSKDSQFSSFVSGYAGLPVFSATNYLVESLEANTTYYYRVRAVVSSVISDSSNTITCVTAPPVPVAKVATGVTPGSFTAGWYGVMGATGYRLDVSTSSSFTSFVSGYNNLSVAGTSRAVTGLSPGTVYYYRVRSSNSSSVSTNSNYVTVVLPPAVPVILSPTSITTTSFTARWESVNGATGYKLLVATGYDFDNADVYTTTSLSYAVTGLSAGVVYQIGVQARGATGLDSEYDVVSVPTIPAAPTVGAATGVTTTGFTANWGSVPGATGYRLDVSTSGSFSSFVSDYNKRSVAGTSWAVTGLSSGTAYYYRVWAYNSSGMSSNSGTITVTTVPDAPVATPATDVSTTCFTADWNSVQGATSYRLDVSKDSLFSSFVSGYAGLPVFSATNYLVESLEANTTYYYRVRAVVSSVISASSNTITCVTAPPVPVAKVATDVTPGSFTAGWYGATGATGYRLDVSKDSLFSSFVAGYEDEPVTGLSHSVTGLSPGTVYYYRVRSSNSSSVSTNSNYVTVVLPPAVPVILSPTSITTTSFTARWESVNGATGYKLLVATGYDFDNADVYTTTSLSYAVTGLSAGVVYQIGVQARGATGLDSEYDVVSVPTIPAAPTVGAATGVTATGFTANWGSVPGATGYRLDVSVSESFESFVDGYEGFLVTSGTSHTVTNLTDNTQYYYRVRAVNASGSSGNSSNGSARTMVAVPLALVATNVKSSSFTARWNSVPGATSYRLDVSTSSLFNSFVGVYNDYPVTSGTSHTVTNLNGNTLYYCRLRAANGYGIVDYSDTVSVVTLSAELVGRNFVKTVTVLEEGARMAEDVHALGVGEKSVSYEFYDGLGRPLQYVRENSSPNMDDIVRPVVYDRYGRETLSYLPYADGSPGIFKTDALAAQSSFYSNASDPLVVYDTVPYAETVYEYSPLNRITEQGSAGAAWRVSKTGTESDRTGRTVRYEYGTNADSSVYMWTVDDAGPVPVAAADKKYYPAGTLYRTRTYGENVTDLQYPESWSEEHVDMDGNTVLTRTFDGVDTLDTYVVYDLFGRARFVITPKAAVSTDINGDAVVSGTILEELCYAYGYDERGRMTEKRLPGAGAVYMVYDSRDRLVLSQDSVQREENLWSFTKYDMFNRPIMTGVTAKDLPLSVVYDSVRIRNEAHPYEDRSTAAGNVLGYTNNSFPCVNSEDSCLTAVYYDDYGFPGAHAFVQELGVATAEQSPMGQVTGGKTRVLGGTGWLTSTVRYDWKYRTVQTVSDNIQGGFDRSTYDVDFVGKIISSLESHTGTQTVSVRKNFVYDHAGRLTEVWHAVNSGDPVLLSKMEYNELGQLIDNKLHGDGQGHYLQSIDYRYNIRGWLTNINDADPSQPVTGDTQYEGNDVFGMELIYNDPF